MNYQHISIIIIIISSLIIITEANNCTKQTISYLKFVQSTNVTQHVQQNVTVCHTNSLTQLLPIFTIYDSLSTSFKQMKHDSILQTNYITMNLHLHNKETFEETQKIYPKLTKMWVKFIQITLKYLIGCGNQVLPCVYVSNNWIELEDGQENMEEKLFETNYKPGCLQNLTSSDIESAIRIRYSSKVNRDLKVGSLYFAERNIANISIQRRVDGNVSFARNWNEYVNGFGDLDGSFWIGLEMIHKLTKEGKYKIRFEMKTYLDDTLWYATYDTFKVGPATDYYRLTIGEFNRGESNFVGERDGMGMMWHNNMQFTAMDQDHDKYSTGSCATNKGYIGGWWFKNCGYVYGNGVWIGRRENGYQHGMNWYLLDGWKSLKYFHMMLIPK